MNRIISLKGMLLIFSLYFSMTATNLLAATSIEIHQAQYISETNTLELIGTNFHNFGLPIVKREYTFPQAN